MTQRTTILLALVAGLWSSAASAQELPSNKSIAAAGATLGPSVEGVTEYRWPNGFRALLAPDASKSKATVALHVFVGSRQESYGEHGIAHLFEHMLFKRTAKIPSIKKLLNAWGSSFNAFTSEDSTVYVETIPAKPEFIRGAIDLEAQRLRSAIISRDELATEWTVVRNELEWRESKPELSTVERMQSAAYRWHNYGKSTIGPASDIEGISNEKLKAWYATYYQPDNAMLVVTGKVDAPQVLAWIGSSFGKMVKPKRILPAMYTREPTQDGPKSIQVFRAGGNPFVAAAYHVPALSDPDSPAIEVLQIVLGATPGGRLYKALVETKKAAGVGCSVPWSFDPGVFTCFATVNAGQAIAPAKDALLSAIEAFQAPADEEVSRAKSSLAKDYQNITDDPEILARELGVHASYGDWRLLYWIRDSDQKVTTADVAKAAKKYLLESNRTLGEFIPGANPVRAEIAARSDSQELLKGFTGGAQVAAGEAFDSSVDSIEARTKRLTLPSGAKLALLEKKTTGETVQVRIVLPMGSQASLKGKSTIADVTADMLMLGTTNRTPQQIKDQLDTLKAELDVRQDGQEVVAALSVKRPQLASALEILGDVLRHPKFESKEFEKLASETINDLERRKVDPIYVSQLRMIQQVSGRKPGEFLYPQSDQEAVAATKAATVAQARDFYERFYGGTTAAISVVGDFDRAAVVEQLKGIFDGWKAKEAYVRIPRLFSKNPHGAETIDTPDKPMGAEFRGQAVAVSDEAVDFPALNAGAYILGGGVMQGRIPERLREKEGLSYAAQTVFQCSPHDKRAVFISLAIFAPKNLQKVQRYMREELAKAISGGVTEEELKRAKEALANDAATARSDDKKLADQLAQGLLAGRTLAYDRELERATAALTVAQVGAALKKYLDVDAMWDAVAVDEKAAGAK